MKALDEADFTIVGVGLMGASLAAALHGKVRSLRGVDVSAFVPPLPYFDVITSDFDGATRDADVIVLATPIRTILRMLTRMEHLKPGALVIDIGSTKEQIVAAMNALPEHITAIGGHPMCGKEVGGAGHADPTMFKGKPFVLCPTRRTTPEAQAFAEQIVALLEARLMVIDAHQHDRAVALISHLPYVVSSALVGTVRESDNAAAWDLASSGFKDTSRLAVSDLVMIGDTLMTNRSAVLDAISALQTELELIKTLLQDSREAELRDRLGANRGARLQWAERHPQ
jgi:prephenate dehydrogenase